MYRLIYRLISVLLLIIMLFFVGVGLLTWVLLRPEKEVYPIKEGPEIIACDGISLKAVLNADQDAHKWVILVHSYRSDHSMMNGFAQIYREKGYNSLQPDNRAHGSSGGDCIGMGFCDATDIMKWIDYIEGLDPHAEIILHGISMGAAALLILSDNSMVLDNVKAIIADSSYTSALDYVHYKLMSITGVRLRIIPELMSWFTNLTAGYSLEEASPLEHVKQNRIPTLFIHGKKDMTVPVDHAYSLYKAAPCIKELYICENAGHGESEILDSDRYWDKVFSFIDNLPY